MQSLINSKYFLWTVLSVLWAALVYRYGANNIVYGEFIHSTGEMSARMMMLAMAVTPLRLLFPGADWTTWLLQRRRYFGVAAFAFASPHLAAYVIRLDPARIANEALELGMLTGWAAFAIFMALALTSNDWSVRRLGRRWKTLHRFVYAAAALTFAHWILTAFDPLVGALHLSVIAILEGFRIWKTYVAVRS